MRYPKESKIKDILESIVEEDFSNSMPLDATPIERTKFNLCKKFVIHLSVNNLSQAALAREICVDRSRINWIVKYRIEKYTIDRLYELWSLIEPSFELKVS
jgi:predicted XRE-type DNA-binding protein